MTTEGSSMRYCFYNYIVEIFYQLLIFFDNIWIKRVPVRQLDERMILQSTNENMGGACMHTHAF